MNIKMLRILAISSLFLSMLMWPAAASAQNVETIECQTGVPLEEMYADVIVNGTSCTLDGATVNGSVLVDGGTLATTPNGASILGSIQVKSGGNITLNATDVSGAVTLEQSGNLSVNSGSTLASISMKDSGYVTIAASASAGEVLVENSGDVAVSGSVAAINSKGSGGVSLTDARVFPGGVSMELATGSLEICGSEIGLNSDTRQDGSGGVTVIESVGGVLAVAGPGCDPSQIEGSVVVEKGTGDVRLAGAQLTAGDLTVIEQTGNDVVLVEGTSLSDVKIEKSTGNIRLSGVTTDSDTKIADNYGNVTIDSSSLGSDVSIHLNSMVTITNNSFALEDVLISNNDGPVVIDCNCDMRLTIIENDNVTIRNNGPNDLAAAPPTCAPCASALGFTDADVSKNSGGVSIVNNTGEGLFCSDNSPDPTGSSNTITFTDGQCAGF